MASINADSRAETGGKIHVAVLMGGSSSERPVSLSTGRQIVEALNPDKYLVSAVDTRDLLSLVGPGNASDLPSIRDTSIGMEAAELVNDPGESLVDKTSQNEARLTARNRADIVFIALHGKGGEDGTVQGMLEFLNLPYTGSGVLASALAMNKTMSKRLFAAAGMPVIPDVVVTQDEAQAGDLENIVRTTISRLGLPIFVKPNSEGSTFGCSLVADGSDAVARLTEAILKALQFDSIALLERYIHGVELTVGVIERCDAVAEALPVVEIVPKAVFYDYESKYADGGSEHLIPARISAEQTAIAQRQALACHALLGCSGMSRTDMILSDNTLYILEVNTIPGMTPTSLLPQAAAHAGIPFSELLDGILSAALCKIKEK